MRFFLKFLARLSTRYPVHVIVTFGLLVVVMAWPAVQAVRHIENDLTQLIPHEKPASRALYEWRGQFVTADSLLIAVEVPPDLPSLSPPPNEPDGIIDLPLDPIHDFSVLDGDWLVKEGVLDARQLVAARKSARLYLAALRRYRRLRRENPDPFPGRLILAWESVRATHQAARRILGDRLATLPPPAPAPEADAARFDFDAPLPEVLPDDWDEKALDAADAYLDALAAYRKRRRRSPAPFPTEGLDELLDAYRAARDAYAKAGTAVEPVREHFLDYARDYVDLFGELLDQSDVFQTVEYRISERARQVIAKLGQERGMLYLEKEDIERLKEHVKTPFIHDQLQLAFQAYVNNRTYFEERWARDPLNLLEVIKGRAARYSRRYERTGQDEHYISPDRSMLLLIVRGETAAANIDYTVRLMNEVVAKQKEAWAAFRVDQAERVWEDFAVDKPTDAAAWDTFAAKRWPDENKRKTLADAYLAKDEDWKAFAQAHPKPAASWGEYAKAPLAAARRASERIRVGYANQYPIVMHENTSLRADVYGTFGLSLALVLVVFMIVYRRLMMCVYLGLPLAIGVFIILGLAGLLFENISVVSGSFAAMLVGLGVDYGIHFYNRYVIERRRGKNTPEAIETAVTTTGAGIVMGGLTTASAFFGIMVTRFHAMAELGFLAGCGILVLLAAMLLVTPAMLVLRSRRGEEPLRFTRTANFGLTHLTRFLRRFPGLTLAACLLLFVLCGAHFLATSDEPFFDPDIRRLRSAGNQAYIMTEKIKARFEWNMSNIIVINRAPTEEQAVEEAYAVYQDARTARRAGTLVDVDTLVRFVPPISKQADAAAFLKTLDFARIRQDIRAGAIAAGWRSERPFRPFLRDLDAVEAAGKDPQYVRIADLKETLPGFDLLLGKYYVYIPVAPKDMPGTQGHTVATFLNPAPQDFTREWYRELARDMHADGKTRQLTSYGLVSMELNELLQEDFGWMTGLVLFLVMSVVVLNFREPSKPVPIGLLIGLGRGLLALAPLVMGMVWMLSLMRLTGWTINPINMVIIPAVIGIAIDHGIHIVHCHCEDRDSEHMIADIGRALMVTSLTTIVAFGSLLTADYYGLVSLGVVAVIGIGCCTITSIVALPACLIRFESWLAPVTGSACAEETPDSENLPADDDNTPSAEVVDKGEPDESA